MKQWGQTPEEIDPEVTGRVPVFISRDNRYFQDIYQGIPVTGYTRLVEEILSHPKISLSLGIEAEDVLTLENKAIFYKGKPFYGKVIFTGAIDELFHCCYGQLPYRSLRFVKEYYPIDSYQERAVVNYTMTEDFTRITEFKKLTGQEKPRNTVIMKEYPIAYTDRKTEIPYYPILNEENFSLYEKYKKRVKEYPNFYLLGRLAEYKYYNMDAIAERALTLADELMKQ